MKRARRIALLHCLCCLAFFYVQQECSAQNRVDFFAKLATIPSIDERQLETRRLCRLLSAISEHEKLFRLAQQAKLIKDMDRYETVLKMNATVRISDEDEFTASVDFKDVVTVTIPQRLLQKLTEVTARPPANKIEDIRKNIQLTSARSGANYYDRAIFDKQMEKLEELFFKELGKLELENTLLFILAHEYGHALLDRDGEQKPNEINADAYGWLLSCFVDGCHSRIHTVPPVSGEMIKEFGGDVALNLMEAVFQSARYSEEVLQNANFEIAIEKGEKYAFDMKRVSAYTRRLTSAGDRFATMSRYEKYTK
jgi:hypothetical protein